MLETFEESLSRLCALAGTPDERDWRRFYPNDRAALRALLAAYDAAAEDHAAMEAVRASDRKAWLGPSVSTDVGIGWYARIGDVMGRDGDPARAILLAADSDKEGA